MFYTHANNASIFTVDLSQLQRVGTAPELLELAKRAPALCRQRPKFSRPSFVRAKRNSSENKQRTPSIPALTIVAFPAIRGFTASTA